MRDIAIVVIVFGLLPFSMRNPVIGIYTWVWLSMMNPHRGAYGFSRGLPFAQMVAIATLLGMISSRHRKPLPMNAITGTLIALLLWMTLTSFFSIADGGSVLERWVFVMKTQVMVIATLMLVRGREQIDWLIRVIVASIAFYGVKGGIYTVLTGGSGRVWGPPGLLEGNNELAVALVMMVPLMVYLLNSTVRKWLRVLLIFSIVTTCFAILGSQSRGALLAIVAMGFFLSVKSKRPVLMSVVIAALLLTAIAFMPDSWTQRMDSIQSYQGDGSAMSRMYTWRTLLNCALDRPLVGAGFVADNPEVFRRYPPAGPEFAQFEGMVFVAHSIYFQMVGEHGFPGLLLFLGLWVVTWRMASRLARATKGDPQFGQWVPTLMPMIQVSMVGYAIGGAFLSLAYLDVPYYFLAIVIVTDASWQTHRSAMVPARPGATASTPAAGPSAAGRTEIPHHV